MGWGLGNWGEFSWGNPITILINGGALAGWLSLIWQVVIKLMSGPKCKIFKHEIGLSHSSDTTYNYGIEILIRNKGNESVSVDDIKLFIDVDGEMAELNRTKQKLNPKGSGFSSIPQIFDIEARRSCRVWAIFQNPGMKFEPISKVKYSAEVHYSNGKTETVFSEGFS